MIVHLGNFVKMIFVAQTANVPLTSCLFTDMELSCGIVSVVTDKSGFA